MDEIKRLLEALGDTPQAIAQSLHERGICGQMGDSERCAIAEYLTQQYADVHFQVMDTIVFIGADKAIPLPFAIEEFVMEFDDGRYPELVSH